MIPVLWKYNIIFIAGYDTEKEWEVSIGAEGSGVEENENALQGSEMRHEMRHEEQTEGYLIGRELL